MSVLIPTLIIAVLILLNALFVIAEFSIVGVSRATIETKAADGHSGAKLVLSVLHSTIRQDRYLATAQIGITITSLGLGMYGEHVLASGIAGLLHAVTMPEWVVVHTISSFLSMAVLTFLHIVLGEMVPKSLALDSAERTALTVAPIMVTIYRMMAPLVWFLNTLGNLILRLFGVKRQINSNYYHTPEELELIVQESQAEGLLHGEAGQVMRELFEFGELTAGEVMVPRVHLDGLPVDASNEQLRQLVAENQHTRYPVYDGDLDHIIGVVHIKDVLRLIVTGQPLNRDMIREAPFIPETTELEAVLERMRVTRTQLVVVMDEHGGTAGVVTTGDLFAELVGEIDEGNDNPDAILNAGSQQVLAEGTVRLDELGDRLGCHLEHEEVDSVSGLVLTLLGRPPEMNDRVVYENLEFVVTKVEGHGVAQCLITLMDSQSDQVENDA